MKTRTTAAIPVNSGRAADFIIAFNRVSEDCNQIAHEHGFHEVKMDSDQQSVKIALMHSELSEALDAIRRGNPPDDHIPNYSGVEAELADTVIRIMDFAVEGKFDIASAIIEKMNHNRNRPFKHGKAF